MVKLRNPKQLTIVLLKPEKDGLFCERILDPRKTGNVVVVSTNVYAIKVWYVTDGK